MLCCCYLLLQLFVFVLGTTCVRANPITKNPFPEAIGDTIADPLEGMSIKHGKLRPGRNLVYVFKIGHIFEKNRTQNRRKRRRKSPFNAESMRRQNTCNPSISYLWSDAGHFKLQKWDFARRPMSHIAKIASKRD